MNTQDTVQRAANHLEATRTDAGWIYYDDSTGKYYLCESDEEMGWLGDLLDSNDPDTSRDAYSLWCAMTTHAECDENGNVL